MVQKKLTVTKNKHNSSSVLHMSVACEAHTVKEKKEKKTAAKHYVKIQRMVYRGDHKNY